MEKKKKIMKTVTRPLMAQYDDYTLSDLKGMQDAVIAEFPEWTPGYVGVKLEMEFDYGNDHSAYLYLVLSLWRDETKEEEEKREASAKKRAQTRARNAAQKAEEKRAQEKQLYEELKATYG